MVKCGIKKIPLDEEKRERGEERACFRVRTKAKYRYVSMTELQFRYRRESCVTNRL